MTTNLTDEFVKKHTLMECLKEFDGAHGNTEEQKLKSLEKPFEALAKKMIYGGYFEVSNNGKTLYRVYIHTIEFYYHEEDNGDLKDWIVYHRNPIKGLPKPLFEVGTLHSHVSGIDITFEGKHPKKYLYRASALIRKFKVKEGDSDEFIKFNKPKDANYPDVEEYPTHLYEYLFMKTPLTDIRVQWIDLEFNKAQVTSNYRINVCKYNNGKKIKDSQDERKWSFSSMVVF
jgi:hypothetical protein